MDLDLQTIFARERITDVINLLFVRTDQLDWPAVHDCFADEVLFDMTSLAGGVPTRLRPQQITDAWEAGLRPLKAVHHQVGNVIVTVRGDEADVFCYGTASHYLPTTSGRNTRVFVGSYDFHLVQTGGRWRVDMFRFLLKYVDGNRNLEAEALRPGAGPV